MKCWGIVLALEHVLFERGDHKPLEKSGTMIGLRGVGKTLLQDQAQLLALEAVYRTGVSGAHVERSPAQFVPPGLRELWFALDRMINPGNMARKVLAVLNEFLGAVGISVEGSEIGRNTGPLKARGIPTTENLNFFGCSPVWQTQVQNLSGYKPHTFMWSCRHTQLEHHTSDRTPPTRIDHRLIKVQSMERT